MSTKRSENGQKNLSKRELYVRSEIRFNTREELEQVKNYAIVHGFRSFNECIRSILLNITRPGSVLVGGTAAQNAALLARGRADLARRAAVILAKSGRRSRR